MSKFSFKSEYFTTPLKLVLPGIIVATTGYYLFNNPEKNRAKATYTTWNVITQFEDMYEKNVDLIPCRLDSFDQVQMKKDLLHIIEMTRQNILDLKDAENIDKRLAAIINLKIDSYSERTKNTESYLDSLNALNYKILRKNYSSKNLLEETSLIQVKFYKENDHITNRDTAVIRSILNDLTKSYGKHVDSFKFKDRKQSVEEIQALTMGKWLTTDSVIIEVNKNGTGHWSHTLLETDFTWTWDTSMTYQIRKDKLGPRLTNLKIKFPNGNFFPLEILKANNDALTIKFHNDSYIMYGSACRR